MIILARGITNAFVTEELFGISVEPKAGQTVGMVCGGITNGNPGPPPSTWHVVRQGKVVEGDEERVEKAFELAKSIKGEPPVTLPDTFFVSSPADYNYDAAAQLATLKGL
jgi:hypothetical protein